MADSKKELIKMYQRGLEFEEKIMMKLPYSYKSEVEKADLSEETKAKMLEILDTLFFDSAGHAKIFAELIINLHYQK